MAGSRDHPEYGRSSTPLRSIRNFVVELGVVRANRLEVARFICSIRFIAADAVRRLALECGHAQSVPLGAIIAGPAIEFDRAFGVAVIGFFELGGFLSSLAKHGSLHPLHRVVFADADRKP